MRIALLVPRVHFHAPFVLRALPPADGKDRRYLAFTTPKISGEPAPFLRKLLRLWGEAGPDYLLAMAAARAGHALRGGWQRLSRVPAERRTSLSVTEALRFIGAEVRPVPSIRAASAVSAAAAFAPDLLCAVFFNQIVPEDLRRLPRLGAINIHPSWLPHYRGVSPCFWVLTRGEVETGVTIHRMTAEIDRGEILARARVPIEERDTLHSLYRKCAVRGGELFADLLSAPDFPSSGVEDSGEGSYFSRITAAAVREFRARGRKFF
ncbi:MAG TPA: formyltransferase family protein [Planctomycetota bacterium]|jgi:hypothetical protein|nr:hypothetical protein [Planctomycetota bacterium]OQC20786.1 MAG: Methionyl-tRNA formyltransferase [Planctomycetes bacterium ADurb.Bin069]NMD37044.1 hypothetical protein [Planctomycetota bacterium]HNR99346.1 formyltransferase family protein [Planctomycetota bacterium]HNU26814.1 formyltransferase family protein [Planctomycetota bacterium]